MRTFNYWDISAQDLFKILGQSCWIRFLFLYKVHRLKDFYMLSLPKVAIFMMISDHYCT